MAPAVTPVCRSCKNVVTAVRTEVAAVMQGFLADFQTIIDAKFSLMIKQLTDALSESNRKLQDQPISTSTLSKFHVKITDMHNIMQSTNNNSSFLDGHKLRQISTVGESTAFHSVSTVSSSNADKALLCDDTLLQRYPVKQFSVGLKRLSAEEISNAIGKRCKHEKRQTKSVSKPKGNSHNRILALPDASGPRKVHRVCYKCQVCDKMFCSKHQNIDSKNNSTINVTDSMAINSSSIRNTAKISVGKRNLTETRTNALQDEKELRLFRCNTCAKCFKLESQLRSHVNLVHQLSINNQTVSFGNSNMQNNSITINDAVHSLPSVQSKRLPSERLLAKGRRNWSTVFSSKSNGANLAKDNMQLVASVPSLNLKRNDTFGNKLNSTVNTVTGNITKSGTKVGSLINFSHAEQTIETVVKTLCNAKSGHNSSNFCESNYQLINDNVNRLYFSKWVSHKLGERFVCRHRNCDVSFLSMNSLQQHAQKEHSNGKQFSFVEVQ